MHKRYPANSTPRGNGQPRPCQADRPADRKPGRFAVRLVQMEQEDKGYTMRPVQLGAEQEEEYEQEDQFEDRDMNHWMDQGFHIGMVQAVDSADARFGCCFNCLEEGYRWRECTKLPLLTELQEILDREALNKKEGVGGKGGHAPQPKKRNGKQGDRRPPAKNPQ